MNEVADIFRKYQSQLQRFIARRVDSKEDGEDILQDVFYQLSRIDMVENPIQQVSSWLYAVTRNLIIDRSRKQREEEMPYLNKSDEDGNFIDELTIMLLDEDASPEQDYIKTMIWEQLELALAELPEEQRVVFELTELQGFSFKEISESTGTTINTLISRKRYAVLHLRKRLTELYKELLNSE